MLAITQEVRSGWNVIIVKGRADATVADELEQALHSAVGAYAKVALDLTGLDYISSAGLRSLLQGARAAKASSAEFIVCSPTPSVKKVFEISGMYQVLKIDEVLPC